MSKEEKEDVHHSYIFAVTSVCLTLIMAVTYCVDSYIKAVYELQATKTRYLRHPYYS